MVRARSELLHASSVAINNRGVLIRGASGAGKSGLALQLMALGAVLVSDDRTIVTRHAEHLVASAPDTLRGKIEARGVGILAAESHGPACLCLVVDLDVTENERLPELHRASLLDVSLPLLRKCDAAHFPAAIITYLKGERLA